MAAYVALTSLIGTIQQLQLLQSKLGLGNTHVRRLKLLYEKVDSLQQFLDNLDDEQTKNLHGKVKYIANETEDEVESLIKVVMNEQWDELPQKDTLRNFFKILQQAIEKVDSLKEELIKHSHNNNLQAGNSSLGDSSTSPRLHDPILENDMVGYNNEKTSMLGQLTRGSTQLEVISITGMGGIGKSTFAKKLFTDPSVLSFFDTRGWITVFENYSYRKTLLALLQYVAIGKEKEFENKSNSELAVCLKQGLMGRRYLVVVDDIWSKQAWDEIRLCLPDDGKRSRVLLTTRDVEVAQYASSQDDPFRMHLLDPDDSWNLFYQQAFGEKGFPIEFENVGKEVAKNCKGLPLMISVVAKILSSKRTLDEWRKVAEGVSSLADVDAYQRCSGVLALSYNHLPSYLKGSFLYFGLFPKASEISVEKLIRLWIAEGLLKVKGMEGLEETAASHLDYLIDKSLVIVGKRSMDGKIMKCMIHDLVHDFCLKEADNQSLFYIMNINSDGSRLVFRQGCRWVSNHSDSRDCSPTQFNDLAHNQVRSFSVQNDTHFKHLAQLHFKLLRVLDLERVLFINFPRHILDLVLLRYLALSIAEPGYLPITHLWNLQTLIVRPRLYLKSHMFLQREIWRLSQLRHLHSRNIYLDSPQTVSENEVKNLVLENLQTISGLTPSCCTKEIFEGIKNVKKLEIAGKEDKFRSETGWRNTLKYLKELEELNVVVWYGRILSAAASAASRLRLPIPGFFPPNLKKLTLSGIRLPWKRMNIFSKLPNLEVLELKDHAFLGDEWEVTETGFPKLKFLLLEYLFIRYWRSTDDYFQCLEHVYIKDCRFLEEIPEGFADSVTLQLIELYQCCHPLVTFAKQIQETHEELGNNMLKVYAFDTTELSPLPDYPAALERLRPS